MRRFRSVLAALLCVASIPLVASAEGATLLPGFGETIVASNIVNPTAMAIAPDGRIFVCEQTGAVRVIKNGTLLTAPFVTLVTDSTGERGLIGITLHPSFPEMPYVFLHYTVPGSPPRNRISRFTAAGDVAVAGSEQILVELDALSGATNHNGGALHFGPDGKLFVGVGENGNPSNAATLANRLGKILRYEEDGTIPSDNPFPGASGANRAIWAFGLRNPFTFAFDPASGRMYVNDVGQSAREEINEGLAGANYGWPSCEGTCNLGFRNPIHEYGHVGGACAIAGGAFYSPATQQFPAEYAGSYFFADLCAGFIRRFDAAANRVTEFATGLSFPVDLRVSSDGTLYYLARGGGVVGAIRFSSSPTPTPTTAPTATPTPTPFTCNGLEATIVGTERGEYILGTAGPDVISGRGGNDAILGNGGDDVICGDDGIDSIQGGAGADRIFGGHGQDWLAGNDGADEIHGSAGDDSLDGGSGTDVCFGDEGRDVLVSCESGLEDPPTSATPTATPTPTGAAPTVTPTPRPSATPTTSLGGTCGGVAPTIVGTESGEYLFGTEGPDVISGRGGNDVIFGNGGNDVLCGDAGNDRIQGGAGADRILGGVDSDVLAGDDGNDDIRGSTGNDSIQGGAGTDACFGEEGTDYFTGCEPGVQ